MQAVYEQIAENLQSGGVAQGSNFWNLYSVGVGSDDPYQVTLADTSTMAVIGAHVRPPPLPSLLLDMLGLSSMLIHAELSVYMSKVHRLQHKEDKVRPKLLAALTLHGV